MSTFTARVTPTSAALDPMKHVNYNLGMVLGVDDFTQEFAYLSGHHQWLARDLLGYGTVSGLRVFAENDAKGPRVVVEPGVAVNPRGQLIRVPTAQCAYLNDWLKLDTTKSQLLARVVSPPMSVRAYVVLCYRECPTDKVPIPGEPCRSEDDVMLPSRLMDDFRLELMLDPPGQREEDAVRDFVAWLSQVTVSDSPAGSTLEEFLNALRAAAHLITSPSDAGSGPLADYMFDSPPGSLVINNADLCGYLDAAFRLWVTELRPKWRPDFFAGAHGTSINKDGSTGKTEGCLLLAEVDVPAIIPSGGVDWQVEDPARVQVDEERRPIVVHLRMLQEMLLCGNREQFLGSPPSGGGGQGGQGPKGDKGDKGPPGDPGQAGPEGPKGQDAPLGNTFIIAAGRFDANGAATAPPLFSFNLRVTRFLASAGPLATLYVLRFPEFRPDGRFVVKGTPINGVDRPAADFEVIPSNDPGLASQASVAASGIVVRVTSNGGFMVEISQFT